MMLFQLFRLYTAKLQDEDGDLEILWDTVYLKYLKDEGPR